jgi:hypothetical protein
LDTNKEITFRDAAFKAFALLLSGTITAIALAALLSDRWSVIDKSTAVTLATFIVWQNLAVIAAKHGLDTYVLAQLAGTHSSTGIRLPREFYERSLLIGLAASVAYWAISKSLVEAALMFVLTGFDVIATMRISELIARRQAMKAALANLLRYPLFFLILLLLAVLAPALLVELPVIWLALLISAALRWLYVTHGVHTIAELLVIPALWLLAIQQVLNYLIFRVDQIIASLQWWGVASTANFLLVSKYVEVMSVFGSTAGAIFFQLVVKIDTESNRLNVSAKRLIATQVLFCFSCVALGLVYVLVFGTPPVDPLALAFAFVSAVLSWHVNLFTYSMMLHSNLKILIQVLLFGLASSGFVVFLLFLTQDFVWLYFVCPVGLMATTLASLVVWKRNAVFCY